MIFFLIISILVRLLSINQGLWLDEAIGAIAAHNYSYSSILSVFLTHDNHPPLYYLFLKLWSSFFGFSDISLRIPGVVIGSLISLYIYKELRKYSKAAFLAALLISISPFLIYYSQEVRMYIFTAFFASVSIFSFWKASYTKNDLKSWIQFSISITALLFTDYVPVFLLPVFLISGFIWRKNWSWWKKVFLAFIPLCVLGILWMPTFLTQVQGGHTVLTYLPNWAGVSGGATLKEAMLVWNKFLLGRISIQPTKLYALILLVFSLPAAASLIVSFIKRDKLITLIWLWFVVPLVLCFIASFVFPAFVYFRFTFVAPAFFILIADGVTKFKKAKTRLILSLLIITGSVLGIYLYVTKPTNQREQWREATMYVEQNAEPNSVSLFEFPEGFAPYKWYSTGKVKDIGGLSEISYQQGDEEKLKSKLINVSTVYYFNYLRDLTDPSNKVKKSLLDQHYKLIKENGDYQGVGIIETWQK